jgi:hypothetical protein
VVAAAQIFDRAQRAAILSAMNLDPAIHVLQLDARAAVAYLAFQIAADGTMTVDVQAKVIHARSLAPLVKARGFGMASIFIPSRERRNARRLAVKNLD